MTIAKTQFPIAGFAQQNQQIIPVPLSTAPISVMPIGIPVPLAQAPASVIPSFDSIPMPFPQAPQLNLPTFSWNSTLTSKSGRLFNYQPNLFSALPQIDYSQLFKNATTSYTPMSNTQFGSLTRPAASSKDKGTYTYDQATVDKLVSKYSGALKHVGDKQAFVKKLVGIANKYHTDANAMLVMMFSEGGLDPSAAGGIFGLIQSTANSYGIDMNAFRNKSAIAQLDDYERILADQVKMVFGKNPPSKISGAILYAMNFTPAYVKDAMNDPNHILVSANSSSAKKREFFYANDGKGSIADGKDYISFDTIQTRLDRKEQEAMLA